MSAAANPAAAPASGGQLADSATGPAPTETVIAYGFWIFLLSDIVMFSALFAVYAVLAPRTAGGPGAAELFKLHNVAVETIVLLTSSYCCGLAMLALERRHRSAFNVGMVCTFVLGAIFLGLEIAEFAGLVARGAGPSRSAFLSSFFALVGLHGLHVSAGLAWLVFLLVQLAVKGPKSFVVRRLKCFALFWHALDIVWVGVLSMVYLMGARG